MGEGKGKVAGLAAAMLPLPIIAVALRLWSRKIKKAGLGADDFTIFPAMLLSVMMCICVIIGATVGNMGQHSRFNIHGMPLDAHTFIVDLKAQYFLQIQTPLASGLTKISLLLLYRRIFRRNRAFQYVTIAFGLIILGWMISFFLKDVLQCVPVSLYWASPQAQEGHCIDAVPSYLAYSITDFVTDIMILSLPVPQVWKLHMPTGRKICVSMIFMLGIFVVVVGAIRIAAFFTAGAALKKSPDISYNSSPTEYWDIINTSTGVVCACLPTLRPIFGDFSPETLFRSLRSALSLQSLRRESPSRGSPPRGFHRHLSNSAVRLRQEHAVESTDDTANVVNVARVHDNAVPQSIPKDRIVVRKDIGVYEMV